MLCCAYASSRSFNNMRMGCSDCGVGNGSRKATLAERIGSGEQPQCRSTAHSRARRKLALSGESQPHTVVAGAFSPGTSCPSSDAAPGAGNLAAWSTGVTSRGRLDSEPSHHPGVSLCASHRCHCLDALASLTASSVRLAMGTRFVRKLTDAYTTGNQTSLNSVEPGQGTSCSQH
jgi:hypothetical protein